MAVLNRVTVDENRIRNHDAWYFSVPAIAQMRRDGLELDPRVTVIVGENGAGKSTFVEALAGAWHSHLRAAVKHWSPERAVEDSDLRVALDLDFDHPIAEGGCFLRAEAMHKLFGNVDAGGAGIRQFDGLLNERSHGESFLSYLESRLTEPGLFILDEPEAALSFMSCLRLLGILGAIAESGSQVIIATHSPVLAAFPGARILEFDEHGITRTSWDELELVEHWRAFLNRPGAYLRHLFPE